MSASCSSALHHVVVDVHRIDRVAHRDAVAAAVRRPARQDLEERACIGLAAVGEEDLVGVHPDAAGAEVALDDRVPDEVVPGCGPVAPERGPVREFVGGRVHRGDRGGRQRLGHVSHAAADDARGERRVALGERTDAARDLGEEVARGQLQVVVVDERHDRSCAGAACAAGRAAGCALTGG
jgi:hypothetical protein